MAKMAKKRVQKPTDQDQIERVYQILLKAMKDNPDIEGTFWVGACWSALVNGYRNSDLTYEQFCEELDSVKIFFKTKWDYP